MVTGYGLAQGGNEALDHFSNLNDRFDVQGKTYTPSRDGKVNHGLGQVFFLKASIPTFNETRV